MGRRLGISLFALALLVTTGVASGEVFQKGNVIVNFQGDFAPRALPRDRLAPITVTVEGRIRTSDGTHPPALQRLKIELNREGRLTTHGLPICRTEQLQSTTSSAALRRCRPALVGRGNFRAELELNGEALPAGGAMYIFNSRLRGRPALLLHLSTVVPVQATLILPLTISHRRGQFGTVLAANVPRLAGGLGSVTHIRMRIGRSYRYRGESLSYLSASCPAPAGFSSANFSLARGNFFFADGRELNIPLSGLCRVR